MSSQPVGFEAFAMGLGCFVDMTCTRSVFFCGFITSSGTAYWD